MVIEKRYVVDTTSKEVLKSKKKLEKALKRYYSAMYKVPKKNVTVIFKNGLLAKVDIFTPYTSITICH